MATTNQERVGKALELLKSGLAHFVSREFINHYQGRTVAELERLLNASIREPSKPFNELDVAALLKVLEYSWNDVYREFLGRTERSLVIELRDIRNDWAHQQGFSTDDAYRALDSAHLLLTAVSSPQPQTGELETMKAELLRVRFDEQARTQRRRSAGPAVESGATGGLPPWREVVIPHKDVRSGEYQQAQFAADLWQVHLGQGEPEYRDPAEFFGRTYLTDSLRLLLKGAIQRLAGQGGDPVIQLQTNFGGGKTHSLLALYHLFSGAPAGDLAGVETVLGESGVAGLPEVKRVVLVGNKIDPGSPANKPDGTVVRTLWGELAYQLGGPEAYARVENADKRATNPGDTLRELLAEYGPALILIDEWVAYARQLHDEGDLPAGSFETQFTFAQALTESAKLVPNCFLVISLPASESGDSPGTEANDEEVGGRRGRAALSRLRNVIGRVDSSWRPATAEESFEIVRRRLFQPIVGNESFTTRDNVARAFCTLYRTHQQEFPRECAEGEYEQRMKAAYPIHPEVFDRLYLDWSALQSFQRTRGVLRLMAAVVHSLWEQGDRNPLVLPANVPLDDPRVQPELTRYLPDNWPPIIESDIDGGGSVPVRLDMEIPSLGKFGACRRVARAIYLGSAPIGTAATQGIEDRHIKLGCVMPGEEPNVFGDALRRLSGRARYLYQDGARYWYSTQPTVARLAEDRALEYLRDRPQDIEQEIRKRLQSDLANRGDFSGVHLFPASNHDVQDALETRLVTLSPEYPYSSRDGTEESRAIVAAKAILESRGNAPRLFRNALAFLAPDETRLKELQEGVSLYLAWKSILEEKEALDLPPHQVRQAEQQRDAAAGAVDARIGETYQWLLTPGQSTPQAAMQWQAIRLTAQGGLAERASRRMRNDELLLVTFSGTRLRMELDRVPLWRGDHVEVRQLLDDFARYLYLPRLKEPDILLEAIGNGLGLLAWERDSFAYADGYDEAAKRYRGLHHGPRGPLTDSDPGLLVRPEVARQQLDAEAPPAPGGAAETTSEGESPSTTAFQEPSAGAVPDFAAPAKAKRYHGSVRLDPTRVGRDASQIADEVIAHLSGLVGAEVRLTLEIEADIPDGAPEDVMRIVTENTKTLKFEDTGFEHE